MLTRTLVRAALVGAGTLAVLAPLTAANAVAATTVEQGSAQILAAPYAVVPYETVNVRKGPSSKTEKVGSIVANQPRGADCWTYGETIVDHGYTNNIWVHVVEGYVSAVYLKGDQYGDLPASAQC
ncbi:SH3 domain-containing protein [Streptomyces sp. NPDC005374]|uniref:SH3 domain-containing protein n=1 Tax=Streptomyces sp. NPDC005374 TaxID=3364713 RepID=UPI00368372E2